MATTQQLEFTQAMQDFKIMFPGMEDGIIEAVLRSNQGAVDATIDQLLAMNTDYENERLRHQLDRDDPPDLVRSTESTASASALGVASGGAVGGAIGAVGPSASADGSLALRDIRGWAPPLVGDLPDDFLRLTPMQRRKQTMLLSRQMLHQKYAENQRIRGALGESTGDPDLDQFLEDERIALFLQNEEFMAELRRNKDFLSALVKEQGEETPPDELPYKSAYKSTLHDDDVFRERLRNMGKLSRKKFAQLARVFTGRKKRSAKQILGQAAAPSKDNLLLNSEPLLVIEDEDADDVPASERHRE